MNYFYFPLEEWTNRFVNNWLLPVLGGFFGIISDYISAFLGGIEAFLIWTPPEIIALVFVLPRRQ
ncbi:MAG: glycine/betaine ABC transporter, partial [Desulfosporosinus sp.]|nr:glycine/betaine ABC transporter [Desulfosporosinus sp.]